MVCSEESDLRDAREILQLHLDGDFLVHHFARMARGGHLHGHFARGALEDRNIFVRMVRHQLVQQFAETLQMVQINAHLTDTADACTQTEQG
jgi:hypothetical protein